MLGWLKLGSEAECGSTQSPSPGETPCPHEHSSWHSRGGEHSCSWPQAAALPLGLVPQGSWRCSRFKQLISTLALIHLTWQKVRTQGSKPHFCFNYTTLFCACSNTQLLPWVPRRPSYSRQLNLPHPNRLRNKELAWGITSFFTKILKKPSLGRVRQHNSSRQLPCTCYFPSLG